MNVNISYVVSWLISTDCDWPLPAKVNPCSCKPSLLLPPNLLRRRTCLLTYRCQLTRGVGSTKSKHSGGCDRSCSLGTSVDPLRNFFSASARALKPLWNALECLLTLLHESIQELGSLPSQNMLEFHSSPNLWDILPMAFSVFLNCSWECF